MAVFEGSSEHGGAFQSRQSYLPREIHWGFQFREVFNPATIGSTQHSVDISQCASPSLASLNSNGLVPRMCLFELSQMNCYVGFS